MRKYFVIGVLVLMSQLIYGQNLIDYYPSGLQKAIKKTSKIEIFEMSEIPFSENQFSGDSQGKFFALRSETFKDPFMYIYVGRVNSCCAGGCAEAHFVNMEQSYEYFDYFVLFDSTKTIQLVRVNNYQASHGYEVSARGWLNQFKGYNGEQELTVGKNIDAISGATISVYAITKNLQEVTKDLHGF